MSGRADVNGDGYDDMIIGTEGAEATGPDDNGGSYVVFGKGTAFIASFALTTLDGSNGFRMSGDAFTYSGKSVAAAGDVNGDGFGDVIIGAIGIDGTSVNNVGGAYILYGRAPDAVANRSRKRRRTDDQWRRIY